MQGSLDLREFNLTLISVLLAGKLNYLQRFVMLFRIGWGSKSEVALGSLLVLLQRHHRLRAKERSILMSHFE